MGRAGMGVWLARAAAVLALAFVVAAVLLVVWGLR
jgi:preprotein translocase subunit SecG